MSLVTNMTHFSGLKCTKSKREERNGRLTANSSLALTIHTPNIIVCWKGVQHVSSIQGYLSLSVVDVVGGG